MFPCLIAETPRKTGTHTADHAISLQVSAAYLGIAVIPSMVGILARTQGLEVLGPILVGGTSVLIVLHEISLAWARRNPI